MEMVTWFFVILAADLSAAAILHWATHRPKPKRKYTRRKVNAKVIPIKRVD